MKLVESHLVLEKSPAELGLVVNERDLLEFLSAGGSSSCVELLGDGGGVVLELLEESRGDGQEVNTSKCLDLSSLIKGVSVNTARLIAKTSDLRYGKKHP